jgi:hypothetical protein
MRYNTNEIEIKPKMQHPTCIEKVKREEMDNKICTLKIAWAAIENTYGIVLGGFLKTRFVDRKKHAKKFIHAFKKSPWKLRYWRLSMADQGLIFAKSRQPDSKPYKSIMLPFGETSFWQNWGKRGDKIYKFGFTLRVACNNIQMDVAMESDRVRRQWMNVLDCVFRNNVQNTKDLLNCLNDNDSPRSQSSRNFIIKNSLENEVSSESCNSSELIEKRKVLKRIDYHTDLIGNSFIIPRRFSSRVYDDDGYMSDNVLIRSSHCVNSSHRKIFDKVIHSQERSSSSNAPEKMSASNKDCATEHNDWNCSLSAIMATCENSIDTDLVERTQSERINSAPNCNIIHLPPDNSEILNCQSVKNDACASDVQEKSQLISPSPSSFTLERSEEINPTSTISIPLVHN